MALVGTVLGLGVLALVFAFFVTRVKRWNDQNIAATPDEDDFEDEW